MISLLLSLFIFQSVSFAETKHMNHMHMDHDKMELSTSEALPEMSLFHVTSSWKDQDGKTVHFKDFSSHPTVFAMAYTSCQHACPIITSRMLEIERKLAKDGRSDVQFLLISLDPKRDTPQKLKEYSKKRGFNLKHWTLLTGNEAAVRELAVILEINYKFQANGDIAHSNVIFLMNKKGVVTNKIIGLDADTTPLINAL